MTNVYYRMTFAVNGYGYVYFYNHSINDGYNLIDFRGPGVCPLKNDISYNISSIAKRYGVSEENVELIRLRIEEEYEREPDYCYD